MRGFLGTIVEGRFMSEFDAEVLELWKEAVYSHLLIIDIKMLREIHEVVNEPRRTSWNYLLDQKCSRIAIVAISDFLTSAKRDMIRACEAKNYIPELDLMILAFGRGISDHVEFLANSYVNNMNEVSHTKIVDSLDWLETQANLDRRARCRYEFAYFISEKIRDRRKALWETAKWFLAFLLGALSTHLGDKWSIQSVFEQILKYRGHP